MIVSLLYIGLLLLSASELLKYNVLFNSIKIMKTRC